MVTQIMPKKRLPRKSVVQVYAFLFCHTLVNPQRRHVRTTFLINYHPPKVYPESCATGLFFFLLGILLGIMPHFFTQSSQKMIHAGAATSHLPMCLPRHGKELRNINFLTGVRTDSSVQKPGWSFQFRRVILPSSIRPIISHQVRIPINQPVQRDDINVSDVG